MLMAMTDIAEYETLVQRLTEKLQQLADENERLRAEGGAYAALRDVYLNPNSSEGNKIKAATASLPFERAKIMPERAPLNLVADADPDAGLSLAELVEKRRKRCYEIQSLPLETREKMVRGIAIRGDGNGAGNGDDTAS
jgi:hypothetical protein